MLRAASLQPGEVVPGSFVVTFVPSTTQRRSPVVSIDEQERALGRRPTPPNFGEHSTGQDKAELAKTLGRQRGKVHRIFDAINAVHVLADADEAEALRKDPRVLAVEPDRVLSPEATAQVNPGWGLDRLDQPSTALNNQYVYTYNGTGQTIYVLDTGLNLGNSRVATEFGGRATLFWDYSGGAGYDCQGHGTKVASAAAGATYGTAKGAKVKVIRISGDCIEGGSTSSVIVAALNNVTSVAARGDIINLSFGARNKDKSCIPIYDTAQENAVRAAYNKGIIVVTSAGNDGCDVKNFAVKRQPEAFVVGGTSTARFAYNQDARYTSSRYGSNIAGFAPGQSINTLDHNGGAVSVSGTSYSAPYVAGLLASVCQAIAPHCQTAANGVVYQGFKSAHGITGSVVEPNGTALPVGTPSRFFLRNGW
jgi:subtilisin family serine protease